MKKNIKLLSIIETLGKGGAERVLVNTLPELQKLGIECEVAILFKKDDLAEELESYGITVHRLNLSYKWNIGEALYKLNHLVKRGHYDILHAHLFFAHFYTGLLSLFPNNFKTVVTFHNLAFDAYPSNNLWKKIRKKIEENIVKNFDRRTAVSTAVKDHYQKHFHLCHIDIIVNSFPLLEFEKYKKEKYDSVLEEYIHRDSDSYIILTPGRLVAEKGHKYLIKAANLLSLKHLNFIFLFVGKGPLENTLKKSAPSNIKIIHEIQHHKLMQLYQEVDLIVIPSIHEAFGLTVGEGMIMEVPIVATSVDGIVEMIDNGVEGVLVPPRNPAALANAIEKIYQDELLRKDIIKQAKEKIKKFDSRAIALKWKQYYEDMLNG